MLIDVESISLRNFFSFGNKETVFDFKKGFNLVLGQEPQTNKRNGCGKTTLITVAPLFALFGKTPKNVKQSDIINWKNKKNCEVSISFTIGSDSFKIVRSLKPNNLSIYKNGIEIQPPSSKVDFDSYIVSDILGLDYDFCSKIMLCNPNDSISIFNTSKPLKRKFLDQLFDIELYTRINEKCNKKLTNIKTKSLLFSQEISSIDILIKSKKDEIIRSNLQTSDFLINKKKRDEVFSNLEK